MLLVLLLAPLLKQLVMVLLLILGTVLLMGAGSDGPVLALNDLRGWLTSARLRSTRLQ